MSAKREDILLDSYRLEWIDITDNSFTAEVFHFAMNSSGGSVSTPVGILNGFKKLYPEFWNVKLILRHHILYDELNNTTRVIVKSAYRSKLKYFIDKYVVLKNGLRVSSKLSSEIVNLLLAKGYCKEPCSITVSEEKENSYLSIGELSLDHYFD